MASISNWSTFQSSLADLRSHIFLRGEVSIERMFNRKYLKYWSWGRFANWLYAKCTSQGEFSFSQVAMLLMFRVTVSHVSSILSRCVCELISTYEDKNYEPSAVVTRTIFSWCLLTNRRIRSICSKANCTESRCCDEQGTYADQNCNSKMETY